MLTTEPNMICKISEIVLFILFRKSLKRVKSSNVEGQNPKKWEHWLPTFSHLVGFSPSIRKSHQDQLFKHFSWKTKNRLKTTHPTTKIWKKHHWVVLKYFCLLMHTKKRENLTDRSEIVFAVAISIASSFD